MAVINAKTLVWSVTFFLSGFGKSVSTKYRAGDKVEVWADNGGPIRRPFETFDLRNLPVCEAWTSGSSSLADRTFEDSLAGHAYQALDKYDIKFGENEKDPVPLCTIFVTPPLKRAIEETIINDYYFVFVVDELPVYSLFGEYQTVNVNDDESAAGGNNTTTTTKYFLYTERHITIERNDDRIISVDLQPKSPVEVKVDAEIPITFTVEWAISEVPYSERDDRYAVQRSRKEREIRNETFLSTGLLTFFFCVFVLAVIIQHLCVSDNALDYAEVTLVMLQAPIQCATVIVPLLCLGLQSLVFGSVQIVLGLGTSAVGQVVLYVLSSWIGAAFAGFLCAKYGVYSARKEGAISLRIVFGSVLAHPLLMVLCVILTASLTLIYGTTRTIEASLVFKAVLFWGFLIVPINVATCLTVFAAAPKPVASAAGAQPQEKIYVSSSTVTTADTTAGNFSWNSLCSLVLIGVALMSPFITMGSVWVEFFFFLDDMWAFKSYKAALIHRLGSFAMFLSLSVTIPTALAFLECRAITTANDKSPNQFLVKNWRIINFCANAGCYFLLLVGGAVYWHAAEFEGLLQLSYYASMVNNLALSVACAAGLLGSTASELFLYHVLAHSHSRVRLVHAVRRLSLELTNFTGVAAVIRKNKAR